jgi:hypothetical protein
MNYDSFTVIKNAKLAIERAEKITKKSREDLQKYTDKINENRMNEKESRECNPYIWKTLDDINYKLNMIIKSLNI